VSMRAALALMILACLAGCTTPYGPYSKLSGTGGYTDKKVSEGQYYIESLTNVPTGPEKAFEYWHRRASELCGGKPYTHDAVLTYKRNRGLNTIHDWPLVVGTATCGK
jgi:hypothetical protein